MDVAESHSRLVTLDRDAQAATERHVPMVIVARMPGYAPSRERRRRRHPPAVCSSARHLEDLREQADPARRSFVDQWRDSDVGEDERLIASAIVLADARVAEQLARLAARS